MPITVINFLSSSYKGSSSEKEVSDSNENPPGPSKDLTMEKRSKSEFNQQTQSHQKESPGKKSLEVKSGEWLFREALKNNPDFLPKITNYQKGNQDSLDSNKNPPGPSKVYDYNNDWENITMKKRPKSDLPRFQTPKFTNEKSKVGKKSNIDNERDQVSYSDLNSPLLQTSKNVLSKPQMQNGRIPSKGEVEKLLFQGHQKDCPEKTSSEVKSGERLFPEAFKNNPDFLPKITNYQKGNQDSLDSNKNPPGPSKVYDYNNDWENITMKKRPKIDLPRFQTPKFTNEKSKVGKKSNIDNERDQVSYSHLNSPLLQTSKNVLSKPQMQNDRTSSKGEVEKLLFQGHQKDCPEKNSSEVKSGERLFTEAFKNNPDFLPKITNYQKGNRNSLDSNKNPPGPSKVYDYNNDWENITMKKRPKSDLPRFQTPKFTNEKSKVGKKWNIDNERDQVSYSDLNSPLLQTSKNVLSKPQMQNDRIPSKGEVEKLLFQGHQKDCPEKNSSEVKRGERLFPEAFKNNPDFLPKITNYQKGNRDSLSTFCNREESNNGRNGLRDFPAEKILQEDQTDELASKRPKMSTSRRVSTRPKKSINYKEEEEEEEESDAESLKNQAIKKQKTKEHTKITTHDDVTDLEHEEEMKNDGDRMEECIVLNWAPILISSDRSSEAGDFEDIRNSSPILISSELSVDRSDEDGYFEDLFISTEFEIVRPKNGIQDEE